MPTIHPLALACTAVLGFLLFGLGLVVSLTRGKTQVLIGVTDDPDHILNRIVRVHGNTAEYAPFLALLFLLCGARQPTSVSRIRIIKGIIFIPCSSLNSTPQRVNPIARNMASISWRLRGSGTTRCCWKFRQEPTMNHGVW